MNKSWKQIKDYLDYCFGYTNYCDAILVTSTSQFLEPHIANIENVLKNEDEEKFGLIKQVRELKDEVASLKSFNSKLWAERQDNAKKLKKQDEILHIIKEKEPSFMRIRLTDSAEHYNLIMLENKKLTQSEFVILKEFVPSKRGHSHD